MTTAGFLPAAGSKTCRRSSYSTATASYASRLSVAVRRPLAPAPNQAPGTRILTLRSACCWPAWCLKNMLTSADERRAVGGIAARRARSDAEPRGARRAPGSQCQGRPSVVVGRTPEGQVSLHVIALRSPLLLGVLWPAALRCPGALQCQPAAGTGVPSAGPSGRPGVLASSAGCTVCNLGTSEDHSPQLDTPSIPKVLCWVYRPSPRQTGLSRSCGVCSINAPRAVEAIIRQLGTLAR